MKATYFIDKIKCDMPLTSREHRRCDIFVTQGKRSATLGLEHILESWQSGTIIEIIRSMPRNTTHKIKTIEKEAPKFCKPVRPQYSINKIKCDMPQNSDEHRRCDIFVTQGKRSATLGLEPTLESWQSVTMIEIIRSMPRNTTNQLICN